MRFTETLIALRGIREQIDRIRTYVQNLRTQRKQEKERLAELRQQVIDIKQSLVLLQKVNKDLQNQAHRELTQVVTLCLQGIFKDMDYKFDILFKDRGGRTQAHLVLLNKGHVVTNPLEEDSGGVVDIAAFTLQLSCLLLSRPELRRIMLLDEPFKNLSVEYRKNARLMLEYLAEELGIQFIIVTHMKQLVIGKGIRL